MVLAGRPAADVLSAVQQMLEYERHDDRMFATLCMLSVAPDRQRGLLHLAGHPRPLLISPSGVRELSTPPRLPLGVTRAYQWPAIEVEFGDDWTILLYTDGLIEGRVDGGPARLGSEGLVRSIEDFAARHQGPGEDQPVERLLDYLVGRVRELNGGDLDDDMALLAVQHQRRQDR
jgi:serine phosphatase RsbU (regulator of sigma subunit)